jgi:GAF domain-containing protein
VGSSDIRRRRGHEPRFEAVQATRRGSPPLFEIIQTISSGPDLDTILRGIVRLVTEATACHACFVYFMDGDELRLRAASSIYSHLEGKVTMPVGAGLAGWVAKTRRSAFIRERALEDPRVLYFPELEEDRFQSLVSVPIFSRAGDIVGVITLHAEAPHEFGREDLDFLENTASLVAGAIENARLYEIATEQVGLLSDVSRLSHRIASAPGIDALLDTVTAGCRDLLRAERVEIYLLDPDERLVLRAALPDRRHGPPVDTRRLWHLTLDLEPGRGADTVDLAVALWGGALGGEPFFALLSVGEERLGLLAVVCSAPAAGTATVLGTVAAHAAVALKQHLLIERLRDQNTTSDLFEVLAKGEVGEEMASAQAARLGCDLDHLHVVLHAIPPGSSDGRLRERVGTKASSRSEALWLEFAGRFEASLAVLFQGSLFDTRVGAMRALLRLPAGAETDPLGMVRAAAHEAGAESVGSIGVSEPCRGAGSFRDGFAEARSAAFVGPVLAGMHDVVAYGELGAYRYVLSDGGSLRDPFQAKVESLIEYDRRRGTSLVETLETYLDGRGNILGTARQLFIHPNTLRQRLGRIEQTMGVDLNSVDWVSLDLALKAARLRFASKSDRADEKGDERE